MVKKGKREVGFSSFRGMNILFYFILPTNSRALTGVIVHSKVKKNSFWKFLLNTTGVMFISYTMNMNFKRKYLFFLELMCGFL